MEHFPNSLGVVEITSSMQTRSRSIGEVIGEVIAKSYVPRYSRPLHVYNSRLLSPGYVPSPGYTSAGTNVTFQPSIIPAGAYPTHAWD